VKYEGFTVVYVASTMASKCHNASIAMRDESRSRS